MFKQSFQQPFVKRPFVPQPLSNKGFVPFKTVGEDDVNQLFMIALEGDYNKIKMAMSNHNISLNVRNEVDQSLIHIVLNNVSSGMQEDQKYELIKMLITNGAPIGTFDKTNHQTALHLACKYQYPSIVKLLIENGANVNALDRLDMTPLHYMIQGNIEPCKKRKKVGSLIPKIAKNTIRDLSSKELKELTVSIIDVLFTENFNQYLAHIKNTFMNIEDMFPHEFEEKEKEFVSSIATVISDTKRTDVDKKELIKNKIMDLTTSFNNSIMGKLQDSTKLFDIGPHNVHGWGPQTQVQGYNKILPKETPQEYNKKINSILLNSQNNLNRLLTDNIKNLESHAQTLLNSANTSYDYLNKIRQLNRTALLNSIVFEPNDFINGPPIPHFNPVDGTFSVLGQQMRDLILNNNADGFPFYEINYSGNIPINDINFESDFLPNQLGSFTIVRGTAEDREKWKKNNIRMESLFLTDDAYIDYDQARNKMVIGNQPNQIRMNGNNFAFVLTAPVGYNPIKKISTILNKEIGIIGKKIPELPNLKINMPGKHFDNKPYYYISKFNYAVARIYRHYNSIKENFVVLQDCINYNYHYPVYQYIIPNIIESCYNIFQHILLAEREKPKILVRSSSIKNVFQSNFNSNQSHPYSYLLEYCVEYATSLEQEINAMMGNMRNIYADCIAIIQSMNKAIDLINKNSGMQIMKSFPNTGFTKKNIMSYENVFDRPLEKIRSPPKNFDEYDKIFGGLALEQQRKLYYEQYAPQFDIKNFALYYNRRKLNQPINLKIISSSNFKETKLKYPNEIYNRGAPNQPKSGIIYTDIYTEGVANSIDIFTLLNTLPDLHYKGYGLTNNKIPYMPVNGISDILHSNTGNSTGKLGVTVFNGPVQKITSPLPSIGSVLDEHLYIIKFILIQEIIKTFNDPDIKDTDGTEYIGNNNSDVKTKMIQIKDEFTQSLETKYSMDSQANPIFFTTIGKIVDDLITIHIKKSVYNGINTYVNNFMKNGGIATDYSKIFNEAINPLTAEIIFKSDTNFTANLNSLYDDLIQQYYTPNTNRINQLMYTVNVMNDENTDHKKQVDGQFRIYNQNYRSMTEELEQQCYKIQLPIIDYLVSAKVNVNKKDHSGSSPLFYAINLMNIDLVNKLIMANANVNIATVKNSVGQTPYDHLVKLYSNHCDTLIEGSTNIKDIIGKFTQPIYKQVKDNLEGIPEFKNNIPRFLENVFPQLIIMYNNLLYFYAKSYINSWSFDKQKQLKKLFESHQLINNSDKLPILENFNKNIIKNSIALDALTKQTELHDGDINKNGNMIMKLNSIIMNLTQERDELNSNPLPHTASISASIRELNIKINDLKLQINSLSQTNMTKEDEILGMNSNIQSKEDTIYNNLIKRTDDFVVNESYLGKTHNVYDYVFKQVSKLYGNVFDYIIKNTKLNSEPIQTGFEDYMLYNSLWKMNIEDENRLKSIYNIHLVATQQQKINLDSISKDKSKQNLIRIGNENNIINELYKNVFTVTVTNLFTLPQNYDMQENYVLSEILDIITHIVGNVLCSNLYYAIIKALTVYLLAINPKEFENKDTLNIYNKNNNHTQFIRTLVATIINPNYGISGKLPDAKLHNYILKEMPKLLVKLKLNIYADDLDEDKDIKSVDDMFQNISNILIKSGGGLIQDNFIVTLNNFIFKYYKEVFDQVIPKMKILIDNYNKYILNEGRFSEMFNVINNMAINEQK